MTEIVPLRPAPTLNAHCADCGEPVEWDPVKDRWGSKVFDDGTTDAWVFYCRMERRGGIVALVDYHYVEPETQRRFRFGQGES